MTGATRRLGVFLNGLPDFEVLFPTLAALARRPEIVLRVYATLSLMRAEPRVRRLLADAGIVPVVRPNRLMKLAPWYRRALRDLDAALVLSDPLNDRTGHARRTEAMAAMGLPTIYLQHGVIQTDLTYRAHDRPVPFHSDLIFLFEPVDDQAAVFATGVKDRMVVGGFCKSALLPQRRPPASAMARLSQYRQRVLFCHSFRWDGRYSDAQVEGFYGMIDRFCRAHPDIAVIIRAHRGKRRGAHGDHDRRLARAVPNVFFSFQHTGELRGLTMTDAVALCDRVVSTASTALLDALYLGRPTAVYLNDSDKFAPLPQVSDADSLAAFADLGWTEGMQAVIERYGDPVANADSIAARIADHLGTLSARSN
jgi:hypothetical protein